MTCPHHTEAIVTEEKAQLDFSERIDRKSVV